MEKNKAPNRSVNLGLLEIEILLYLLNSRTSLGPYADSSKRKLQAARIEILGPEYNELPPASRAAMHGWDRPDRRSETENLTFGTE